MNPSTINLKVLAVFHGHFPRVPLLLLAERSCVEWGALGYPRLPVLGARFYALTCPGRDPGLTAACHSAQHQHLTQYIHSTLPHLASRSGKSSRAEPISEAGNSRCVQFWLTLTRETFDSSAPSPSFPPLTHSVSVTQPLPRGLDLPIPSSSHTTAAVAPATR